MRRFYPFEAGEKKFDEIYDCVNYQSEQKVSQRKQPELRLITRNRVYTGKIAENPFYLNRSTLMRWKLLEIRFAWTEARLQPWYNIERKILLYRLNCWYVKGTFFYTFMSIWQKNRKKSERFPRDSQIESYNKTRITAIQIISNFMKAI